MSSIAPEAIIPASNKKAPLSMSVTLSEAVELVADTIRDASDSRGP